MVVVLLVVVVRMERRWWLRQGRRNDDVLRRAGLRGSAKVSALAEERDVADAWGNMSTDVFQTWN